jgi:hypothetical protein
MDRTQRTSGHEHDAVAADIRLLPDVLHGFGPVVRAIGLVASSRPTGHQADDYSVAKPLVSGKRGAKAEALVSLRVRAAGQ